MKLILLINSADGARVAVYKEAEDSYQVQIKGSPDATYHTSDRQDALRMAGQMIDDIERNARKEELQ